MDSAYRTLMTLGGIAALTLGVLMFSFAFYFFVKANEKPPIVPPRRHQLPVYWNG